MENTLYETFHETSPLGISFAWFTNSGGHHPLHWHDEVEILFPLSGEADIVIDGSRHNLLKRHLLVVESGQVHSSHSESGSAMFLCIHFSKTSLKYYLPNIGTFYIDCLPDRVPDDQFVHYLKLCKQLEYLTQLYIEDPLTFYLKADGIILQVIASLIEHFSITHISETASLDALTINRIHQVIAYVEQNFRNYVSLEEIAAQLGFSKEYFCRFFKKNLGISFLQYVNEIRISYIYYDLLHTDLSVLEIMEKNGFTNQKLFNQMFKKIYGCTPTETRKKSPPPQLLGLQKQ